MPTRAVLYLILFLGTFTPWVATSVSASTEVAIDSRIVGADILPPFHTAKLVLKPLQVQHSDLAHPIELDISVPGVSRVEVPFAGSWNASLRAASYWSETRDIDIPREATVQIRLFPVADLSGSFTRRLNQEELPGIEATFSGLSEYSVPTSKEALKGKVACGSQGTQFRCQLPAQTLDIRISVTGYAPIYLWAVNLNSEESLDIGEVDLKRGGSVAGWATDVSDLPLPDVLVRAEVATMQPATDIVSYNRLRKLSLSSKTNDRGFFQIAGIPEGSYRLVATKPHFSTAYSTEDFHISGDLEIQLPEPLIMTPRAELLITLEPPKDHLGHPWHVELFPLAGSKDDGSDNTARYLESSQWHWSNLEQDSPYRLIVKSSDGSEFLAEEIRLERSEQYLFFEVPLVEVRGAVEAGDAPVSGSLRLIHRDGARVHFDVDDLGRFSGYVTQEGYWLTEFQPSSSTQGLVLKLHAKLLKKKEHKDYVELLINIPDTHLEGEVVDAQGKPVPRANIAVTSLPHRQPASGKISEAQSPSTTRRSEVRTDAEGRFEIRGFPPGTIDVTATLGRRISETIRLEVDEESEASPLRLTLLEMIEVSGLVFSAAGPVSGAFIVAWGDLTSSAPSTLLRQATSDAAGAFFIDIPSNVTSLNFMVQAPGFATGVTRLPVTANDGPIFIELERFGGNLVVELPPGPRGAMSLLVDQTFIPLALLSLLAEGKDSGRLEFPNLQPGIYTFCHGHDAFRRIMRGLQPDKECSTGGLSSGGTLVLRSSTARSGQDSSNHEEHEIE